MIKERAIQTPAVWSCKAQAVNHPALLPRATRNYHQRLWEGREEGNGILSNKKMKSTSSFSQHTLHSSWVLFLVALLSQFCSTFWILSSSWVIPSTQASPQLQCAPVGWTNYREATGDFAASKCFSQCPWARISVQVLRAEQSENSNLHVKSLAQKYLKFSVVLGNTSYYLKHRDTMPSLQIFC